MRVQPTLKGQHELERNIALRMRDPDNKRWSRAEIYRAINDAMDNWRSRVYIPMVFNFDTPMSRAQMTYTVPAYIEQPLMLQYQDAYSLNWHTLDRYELEPDLNDANEQVIRVVRPCDSTSARIIWWGSNGHMSDQDTTLLTRIAKTGAGSDYANVDTDQYIGDAGYIQVDDEIMFYDNLTPNTGADGGFRVDLKQRAINWTRQATHDKGTPVQRCVAVPDERLWEVLYMQASRYLNLLYLTDASARERAAHEKMVNYADGWLASFWRSWTPNRPVRLVAEPLSNDTWQQYEYIGLWRFMNE